MNVILFPTVCLKGGRIWHGGRGFKTKQALIDALSDRDWRRVVDWQNRNWDWLRRNDGKERGTTAQGGGNAA